MIEKVSLPGDCERTAAAQLDRPAVLDQEVLRQLAALGRRRGRDVLGQSLDLFESQVPAIERALADAARAADPRDLAALAHRLKGSALALGALRLAAACERMERSGEAGAGREAALELPELLSALAATRDALHAYATSAGVQRQGE
jgi:HPt (histidine-containing phosphotransfer) domain-containing protein